MGKKREKRRKENGIQTDKRRSSGVCGTARDVGKRREKKKGRRLHVRNERSSIVYRNATNLANLDEIVGDVEKRTKREITPKTWINCKTYIFLRLDERKGV